MVNLSGVLKQVCSFPNEGLIMSGLFRNRIETSLTNANTTIALKMPD